MVLNHFLTCVSCPLNLAWYNALLWFQSPCSSDLLCSQVCDRREKKGDADLLGTATEDYLGGKAYKLHS